MANIGSPIREIEVEPLELPAEVPHKVEQPAQREAPQPVQPVYRPQDDPTPAKQPV